VTAEGPTLRLERTFAASPERVFAAWTARTAATTVVTVQFRPVGEGTTVVLTQTGFASADVRDEHGVGWRACLDNLDARVLGADEMTPS
jgi:uncharacterized protein YndB with AHSA1/START domain